jgi:translation initiation factor IF-3
VDQDGSQVGVVSLRDALDRAEAVDLDLVEIAPNAEPPVCRIMDFGKHIFEISKKKAAQKKKQKQTQVKEIKLRPTTDIGDYNVKIRSITRFLEDGDKVKVTVRFRGRELMHPELGLNLLKKIEAELVEIGGVEQQPKLEGKQIIMIIAPKR